ncbi:YqaA family protein [Methanopyrus kandleri]
MSITETLVAYFMDFERAMGLPGMLVITALECSVLPVPPEPFVFPFAMRMDPWVLATLVTLSSIAGSLLGYAIGYFGGRPIAVRLVGEANLMRAESKLTEHQFSAWAAVFLAGLLQFVPFKPFTIGAGLVEMDLRLFITAVVTGRFLRFLFLGYVAQSETVRNWISYYLGPKVLKMLISTG